MDPETLKLTKVFIGGIKDLTKADITEHFSKFGEFHKDIDMVNDQQTGNPKFAFIQYKHVPDCDSCITSSPHQLKGSKLYARLAVNKELNNELREVEKAMKNNPQGGRLKVFIGGLPPQATEETIKKALGEHVGGIKVSKAVIKKNRETDKPRGFGFLTLDHDHDVHKACEIRHFFIDGKKVECKLAPDSSINVGGQGGGFRGGRGGGAERGGGFGGRGGRGGRGGSSGGWQQQQQQSDYGNGSGYGGGGYDVWGGETYDDGSSYNQAATADYSGYSQTGNGYDQNYEYYGQNSYDSYYGSGDTSGYGQSSGGGGYGGGRGAARGRGASSGSGGYSSGGGRGASRGARGSRGGGARQHPYQQSY